MTSFPRHAPRASMAVIALAIAFLGFTAPTRAAIIGTYVDAKALNTTTTPAGSYTGDVNTTPSSAFATPYADSFGDSKWDDRPDSRALDHSGATGGSDGNVLEAGPLSGVEIVPTLTTTVSGLAASTYDVYVLYWSVSTQDWSVRAKFNTEPDTSFKEYDSGFNRPAGPSPIAGTALDISGAFGTLYEAKIGTVTGTSIAIDVQNSTLGGNSRTEYEGIAYSAVPLPEPASLSLLVGFIPLALRRRRVTR